MWTTKYWRCQDGEQACIWAACAWEGMEGSLSEDGWLGGRVSESHGCNGYWGIEMEMVAGLMKHESRMERWWDSGYDG